MGGERTGGGGDEPSLSVSVVVYRSDLAALRDTIAALRTALDRARDGGLCRAADVWLVDNGSPDEALLDRTVREALGAPAPWLRLEVLRGHGNVGYGAGHDLAIARSSSTFHLVLNPDVVMAPDALLLGLGYLRAEPRIGMLAPHVADETGARQYLCKRYPSVLVLVLRGFAPAALRRVFRRCLDHYEMRDLPDDRPTVGIPIASGAFMLARRSVLQAVGGFAPEYFLYFEDFDLSLRLGRVAPIAYVPAVRIVHTGGNAAAKGWLHRKLFMRSGLRFFRTHGWKLW